jgi:hypothetical protein
MPGQPDNPFNPHPVFDRTTNKHHIKLKILCDGLDSCEAKKKGCSQVKCLEFVSKIAEAMSYADYWSSGVAGWWDGLPWGQGKCHEWSRLFYKKMDDSFSYYSHNRKEICMRWPENLQMKCGGTWTPVHNINVLCTPVTGCKLVVDDGFLEGMGQIYTLDEAMDRGFDIFQSPE